MNLLQHLKISMDNNVLGILTKYANPATLCTEGSIGPIEIVSASILQKFGLPVTVDTVDKIAAHVCNAVKMLETEFQPLMATVKEIETAIQHHAAVTPAPHA